MIWDEAEVGGLQYWVKWYVSQQNFCLHFHQIPVNVRKTLSIHLPSQPQAIDQDNTQRLSKIIYHILHIAYGPLEISMNLEEFSG